MQTLLLRTAHAHWGARKKWRMPNAIPKLYCKTAAASRENGMVCGRAMSLPGVSSSASTLHWSFESPVPCRTQRLEYAKTSILNWQKNCHSWHYSGARLDVLFHSTSQALKSIVWEGEQKSNKRCIGINNENNKASWLGIMNMVASGGWKSKTKAMHISMWPHHHDLAVWRYYKIKICE